MDSISTKSATSGVSKDSTSVGPCGTAAVELVLAASDPVSLDELVDWQLARPTDLWHWLGEARAGGVIADDPKTGEGWFVFRDDVRRGAVLRDAREEDWRSLMERQTTIPRVLANARRAAKARRVDAASRLYRGLIRYSNREAFPGGVLGWLQMVVEVVHAFRAVEWIDAEILDEALSVAVSIGDLRFQAVLAAARGFTAIRTGRDEEARACMDRAVEAAQASGDRAVEFEVFVRIAFVESMRGRPREAVAAFERFLSDVPEELVPLPLGLASASDPVPEAPLAVLASLYAQIGQFGRGIELLHRLLATGIRLDRPDLAAYAHANLAFLHMSRRELEPARVHGEPAFAFFSTTGIEPYFLWRSSIALAWVQVTEGEIDEARKTLEVGQRARLESGLQYFAGSGLFEVLDRLEIDGARPPEGLDYHAEIERMFAWADGYMDAVAHRFMARRLAREDKGHARAAEIDRHYALSVEILRASGACPIEFARSLDEAGDWARSRSRAEEANQLEDEAHRVRSVLDLGSESDLSDSSDPTLLATALIELGRLDLLADRTEGVWGDLAARLCAMLRAERCALIEEIGMEHAISAAGPAPATAPASPVVRTVAARGGGDAWVSAVESLVQARCPAEPADYEAPSTDLETPSAGRLLVVPFASARLRRRGWAALETRRTRMVVSASDRRFLEAMSSQLGVLLENVAMWQELVAARQRLELENRYYRQAAPARAEGGGIVGDSPALRRTLELVVRVAPSTAAVLIQGETGVGKERIATEIHRRSSRSNGPFIAVHIASLAPGLVASALFGHERGAFTGATEQTRGRFELADGGTLFLDEIGDLGAEDQVRILRVLQEGTFERVGSTRQLHSDFRLIAATNRDLMADVQSGRFREDLYYRLAAFPIEVPPLRQRTEEIPTLALYFMERASRNLALTFEGISEADMERLLSYSWPGNIRELEHMIERAVLLSDPPRLRIPPLHVSPVSDAPGSEAPIGSERITLEEAERRYLRDLIRHTQGRVTGRGGAAEIAGLKPSTLNWHVEKLGLREVVRRARAERG